MGLLTQATTDVDSKGTRLGVNGGAARETETGTGAAARRRSGLAGRSVVEGFDIPQGNGGGV